MAFEGLPSNTKEWVEIKNAETIEEQLRLCARYICTLQRKVITLTDEVEKQEQLKKQYKKALDEIDMKNYVLQFNPDEFLDWAKRARRKSYYKGVENGKKIQMKDDEESRRWDNYDDKMGS